MQDSLARLEDPCDEGVGCLAPHGERPFERQTARSVQQVHGRPRTGRLNGARRRRRQPLPDAAGNGVIAAGGGSGPPVDERGGTSPRWLGRCPHRVAWNALDEVPAEPAASWAGSKHRFQRLARSQPGATLRETDAADVQRPPAAHDELDRVLGGGIAPGGVVLIGGDPGIGKRTLQLQLQLQLQALDLLSAQMKLVCATSDESLARVAPVRECAAQRSCSAKTRGCARLPGAASASPS
jgi:hypothetical protein